jgi:hypothetical protein
LTFGFEGAKSHIYIQRQKFLGMVMGLRVILARLLSEGSIPFISTRNQLGVAQSGRAFGLGPKGRGFESLYLDQQMQV